MVVVTAAERIFLINKMYRDVGINHEQLNCFAVATAWLCDRLVLPETNFQ